MSETERREKLQEAVRSIILDVFDATEGPDFSGARDYMSHARALFQILSPTDHLTIVSANIEFGRRVA